MPEHSQVICRPTLFELEMPRHSDRHCKNVRMLLSSKYSCRTFAQWWLGVPSVPSLQSCFRDTFSYNDYWINFEIIKFSMILFQIDADTFWVTLWFRKIKFGDLEFGEMGLNRPGEGRFYFLNNVILGGACNSNHILLDLDLGTPVPSRSMVTSNHQ